MVSGGPQTQLHQTAKFLPNYGVEVELFNQWKSLDQRDYDLVHLFGANYINHDLAMRLSHFKIPYLVSPIFYTRRHPSFIRFSRKLENFAKKFFLGIWTDYGFSAAVCRHSAGILPNTTAEARLIEKGFEIPKEKIEVVPNGVEARFRDADPSLFVSKYGIKDFILNVGHIGSLRKNALRLVKALSQIDHPAVIIAKVHNNAYANLVLQEAKKNSNLLIIEGIDHHSDMLASAYAACDVFVLPSYFETPGIAALEAAVAGAKIVITDVGGTKEYFGDDAIYVNHRSVSSIKKGIQQGLNQKKHPALKERILKEYNWEKIAGKTAAAYRRLRVG